jgi:carboxypeptidase-like protein
MKTQTGGRFCGSCAKSVIDFTKLSDNQIISLIEKSNGRDMCGRFDSTQLNKIMVQTNAQKNNPALYKILAGLLLLTSLEGASAQTVSNRNAMQTVQPSDIENRINGKVAITLVINGVVLDENAIPLPGVNVFSERSKTSAMTDFDGKFSMNVMMGETLTLSYLGFQTLRTQVKGPEMEVKLNPDVTQNVETYMLGYVKVRKPEKKD